MEGFTNISRAKIPDSKRIGVLCLYHLPKATDLRLPVGMPPAAGVSGAEKLKVSRRQALKGQLPEIVPNGFVVHAFCRVDPTPPTVNARRVICQFLGPLQLGQCRIVLAVEIEEGTELACLERLRLSPGECLFVDDSARNVQAALDLGFHAIHFTSSAALRTELDEKYRVLREERPYNI